MNSKTIKVVKYSEVPVGAVFRVLKEEVTPNGRVIKNDGTYQRVDHSHSVEIHDAKTAIFAGSWPCRIITTRAS